MKGFKLSIVLLLCFCWSNAQEKPKPATKDELALQREEFCPTLNVSCPDTVETGQRLIFSANFLGDVKPAFNWTLSKGGIIEGQGTPLIKVDTRRLRGECVVATVAIGGLGQRCNTTLLCKTFVTAGSIIDPMVFDRYERLRWKDEKARLDNIAEELKGKTDAEINIFAFDGLNAKKGTASALANRARRYLITKQRIKPELVRIVGDKDFVGFEVARKMHLDFYIQPHNLFDPCHEK